jgi:hypothetical protein
MIDPVKLMTMDVVQFIQAARDDYFEEKQQPLPASMEIVLLWGLATGLVMALNKDFQEILKLIEQAADSGVTQMQLMEIGVAT